MKVVIQEYTRNGQPVAAIVTIIEGRAALVEETGQPLMWLTPAATVDARPQSNILFWRSLALVFAIGMLSVIALDVLQH